MSERKLGALRLEFDRGVRVAEASPSTNGDHMVYISGEDVDRAVREREVLGREMIANEARTTIVLIGTSAIIYLSLALLFEPLLKFSTASLRLAMLFAPIANAAAWTFWAAHIAFSPRLSSRHEGEIGEFPTVQIFEEVEYVRFRIRRQARFGSFITLLSAMGMVSLAYGIALAAAFLRF